MIKYNIFIAYAFFSTYRMFNVVFPLITTIAISC